MPVISDFYGIKVYMYFNDNTQHYKPHIHVFYGEFEAVLGLDADILAGSFPKKQYRLVSGWMALNEAELYAAWNEAVKGNHPNRIKPLI